MNKKQLEERLAAIDVSLKQTNASFNMLEGAKQEALYWLSLASKEETDAKEGELLKAGEA
jgi:hypothetical protein